MLCGAPAASAEPSRARGDATTALTVERIGPPRYVRASDGRVHINYDLLLTNSFVGDVTLKGLEIRSGRRVIQRLDAEQFAARTQPILQEGETSVLGPSSSAAVLVDIPLPPGRSIPRKLNHRISYELPQDFPPNAVIDSTTVHGPRARVPRRRPLTIAPPLRGSGWWAGGGCCDANQRHRALLLANNGRLVATEMFDIDWLRVVDNRLFTGDGTQLSDYPGYGQPIHAAAGGRVVKMIDGKPEAPLSGPNPDLNTADDFGGNQVVVKIAPRRYAFYAHFQPGSVRVERGERVRTGQVLGLLGNSGNSAAPHLHFGIHNGPAPATSASLPFRIDRYRYEGSADLGDDGSVPLQGTPHSERKSYPLNLSSQGYRP
jgi:Peptidase family M23